MNLHTPEIFQTSILISNSRKDMLVAAMREAAERAQKTPTRLPKCDPQAEKAARAEHLAIMCECI